MGCQQTKNQQGQVIQNQYKPLVISGCSGAGKGTLVKKMLSKHPELFELSVSLATRNPRQGQEHGREYYFVKKQQFQQQIAKKVFVEYCQVHGNYYGTHKDYVNEIVKKGKIAILQIDLQGGSKVNASGMECNYLFIDIPSLEVLRERLVGRGTQTEETVNKRMKNAEGELQQVSKLDYYHRIMNDQLDQCVSDVEKWIAKTYHLELQG